MECLGVSVRELDDVFARSATVATKVCTVVAVDFRHDTLVGMLGVCLGKTRLRCSFAYASVLIAKPAHTYLQVYISHFCVMFGLCLSPCVFVDFELQGDVLLPLLAAQCVHRVTRPAKLQCIIHIAVIVRLPLRFGLVKTCLCLG